MYHLLAIGNLLIAFWLAQMASIIVHEFGHAICQLSCLLPVQHIQIGSGSLLFRIGILHVHLFPFRGGIAPVGSMMTQSRAKGVLIALAGTSAQLLAAMLLLFFHPHGHLWPAFKSLFTWLAAISLVEWIPFEGNDGCYALQSWKNKKR